MRHCFATRLLLNGIDVRQIQDWRGYASDQQAWGSASLVAVSLCPPPAGGHANVETTMIYTRVVKELRNPAKSPLDLRRGWDAAPNRLMKTAA